jgi:hypothetical protein
METHRSNPNMISKKVKILWAAGYTSGITAFVLLVFIHESWSSIAAILLFFLGATLILKGMGELSK